MQPAAKDSRSGHLHGLSIRLADGTLVSLEAVLAEGRRQRAREIRRLVAAAAHRIARIARTTARTFASLAPAHQSRHKIPG
jgi:16S rRNA U516 pseudouridylate synthase RsuA-like enzyme